MTRVNAVFQEFQHRRDGLIKALNTNLDTLIEEAKKINNETPYVQRKCLWGLEDRGWELRHAAYPNSTGPPQPQPLPPFEGMSPSEWTELVADFSFAWLIVYAAYLSSSFSLEERKELVKMIDTLPLVRNVIVLEDKYTDGWNPDVEGVLVPDGQSSVPEDKMAYESLDATYPMCCCAPSSPSFYFCDNKMSRVHTAFQEFQQRRDGLIKALNTNLDTLIEEAKKIGNETPYLQRKCLWGLEDRGWELRHAAYPNSEAPPQPEPLPPFGERMSRSEWTELVSSFSYGWLIAYAEYLSSSFSLEERKELVDMIVTLPLMRDVIVLKDKYTAGRTPDLESVVVPDGISS